MFPHKYSRGDQGDYNGGLVVGLFCVCHLFVLCLFNIFEFEIVDADRIAVGDAGLFQRVDHAVVFQDALEIPQRFPVFKVDRAEQIEQPLALDVIDAVFLEDIGIEDFIRLLSGDGRRVGRRPARRAVRRRQELE